jgi:hypothetical protein
VADITEHPTGDGTLYLAVGLDAFSPSPGRVQTARPRTVD